MKDNALGLTTGRRMLSPAVFVFALLFALFSSHALADSAGTVKTSKGTVTLHRNAQKIPVVIGMKVESGDRVITGTDGSVGMMLRDNTSLSCGPNSTLVLDQYSFNNRTYEGELTASVKRGTLAVISGKIAKANPDSVRFETKSMTLGVRGTEFVIEAGGGSNE